MDAVQEDFTIAKVNGRWARFAGIGDVPGGAAPVGKAEVEAMSVEEIGEIYSEVAGVGPKKFSTKEVAVASLNYQLAKMLVKDHGAQTLSTSKEADKAKAKAKAPADGSQKRVSRMSGMLEVLAPDDLGKALGGLAPQAQELVSMLAEVAKVANSATFPAAAMAEVLERPDATTRLKTKQPASRIFSYYKKTLEEHGLLRSF